MKRVVKNLDDKSKAVWFNYFHKPENITLKHQKGYIHTKFKCGSKYWTTALEFKGSPLCFKLQEGQTYSPDQVRKIAKTEIPWADLIAAQPFKWNL